MTEQEKQTHAAAVEDRLREQAAKDITTISERELHAHYAALGPYLDVAGFMSHPLTPDLLQEATDLKLAILRNDGQHTPATRRAYQLLHQHWRAWRNAEEGAARLAAAADLRHARMVEGDTALASIPTANASAQPTTDLTETSVVP